MPATHYYNRKQFLSTYLSTLFCQDLLPKGPLLRARNRGYFSNQRFRKFFSRHFLAHFYPSAGLRSHRPIWRVRLVLNFFTSSSDILNFFDFKNDFNRYRRGLDTCAQAKTSKSGHAFFFSFFRRVRATSMTQPESKILASTFGRFCLYRLRNELKLNKRPHRVGRKTQDQKKISNVQKMDDFLDHIFVTILTNSSLLGNWNRKNCHMSEMIR